MKNIHILPTPNRQISNIGIIDNKLFVSKIKEFGQNPQNIYITSDEEFKECDFGYNTISKTIDKFTKSLLENKKFYKKIILTTDTQLIADGVQAIDDEFLEWFVKNPSCESVEVENKKLFDGFLDPEYGSSKWRFEYKIIIPKEEPKPIYQQIIDIVGGENKFKEILKIESKQETLEEAKKKFAYAHKKEGDMAYEFGRDMYSFEKGAKWQAERSYSEEEVLELLQNFNQNAMEYIKQDDRNIMTSVTLQKWFEQFKKK